jgi:hypothetical protein
MTNSLLEQKNIEKYEKLLKDEQSKVPPDNKRVDDLKAILKEWKLGK